MDSTCPVKEGPAKEVKVKIGLQECLVLTRQRFAQKEAACVP